MPGQTESAQIHAQARPDLCWQAAGNGSPVTLEHCGSAEGQQWTLAGHGVPMNGVLMNGNGYCLQAGPRAGDRVRWAVRRPGRAVVDLSRYDRAAHERGPRKLRGAGRPAGPRYPGRQRGLRRRDAVEPGRRGDPGPARGVGPAAGDTRAGGGPPEPGLPAAGSAAGLAPGPAAGGGLLLAALLAGLLLMTGATLVFFGRRSRRAGRSRPAAHPAAGPATGAPHDDGPYVVDLTDEVAQRQRAQGEVDARPTEPFDVSSLP